MEGSAVARHVAVRRTEFVPIYNRIQNLQYQKSAMATRSRVLPIGAARRRAVDPRRGRSSYFCTVNVYLEDVNAPVCNCTAHLPACARLARNTIPPGVKLKFAEPNVI